MVMHFTCDESKTASTKSWNRANAKNDFQKKEDAIINA